MISHLGYTDSLGSLLMTDGVSLSLMEKQTVKGFVVNKGVDTSISYEEVVPNSFSCTIIALNRPDTTSKKQHSFLNQACKESRCDIPTQNDIEKA